MLGFLENISYTKIKCSFKNYPLCQTLRITAILVLFLLLMFSFQVVRGQSLEDVQCEESFLSKLWIDPYGQEKLDNFWRYCFAEALIKQIDNGYLKSVPKLKPDLVEWIQDELSSDDIFRVEKVRQDKDYARYKFFLNFQSMRNSLAAVQLSITLGNPADEMFYWLQYVHVLSSDTFNDHISIVREEYFPIRPGKIEPFSAIGPYWFHDSFILKMLMNNILSGNVEVVGKRFGD